MRRKKKSGESPDARKRHPASAGVPTRTCGLPINELDTTYADRVRVGPRDESHVRRIQHAYLSLEPVPPAEVVTWPGGKNLLADGGYRRLAHLENGKSKMRCRVYVCESEEKARDLAARIAGGANVQKAMGRTAAEEREAAKLLILLPSNATASDREIERDTGCHPTVVKSVRLELSHDGLIAGDSPAHAFAPKRYDRNSLGGPRKGSVYLIDGRVVPDPRLADGPAHVISSPSRDNATAPAAHVSSTPAPTKADDADASDDTEQACTSTPDLEPRAATPSPRAEAPAPTPPARPASPPIPEPEDVLAACARSFRSELDGVLWVFAKLMDAPGGEAVVRSVADDLCVSVTPCTPDRNAFGTVIATGWNLEPLAALGRLADEVQRRANAARRPAAA